MFIMIDLMGDENDVIMVPATPEKVGPTEDERIAWEEELMRRALMLQIVPVER